MNGAITPKTLPAQIWTEVMISILSENFLDMSDNQLSKVVGVKLYVLRAKIRELNLKRVKPKPERKKYVSPDESSDFQKRLKQEKLKNIKSTQLMEENRRKRNVPLFKTKEVDLTGMYTIRVDSKTWIYVKPGDDVEALKRKYSRELTKTGLSKIEWQ